MIKTEEFEMAESKQEQLWLSVKERTEKIIQEAEINLEINKEILRYAEKKLKEISK